MDVDRRTFLSLGVGGASTLVLGLDPNGLVAVPADKGLTSEAVQALVDRGTPTEYTGAALAKIGMPVGGGCCGQVYLAGDGRLWAWDIFNPGSFPLGGATGDGPHYANPMAASSPPPFKHGFAIRTTANGSTQTRTLDANGFPDVRFVGQYPIGKVAYKATDSPVEVTLDAFSPFVPGQTDDSTLPAIMLVYTVKNTSTATVQASLLGFTENPVCLRSRSQQPTGLRATALSASNLRGVESTAFIPATTSRPDIVFEDWERATYDGWTVSGTAFGAGPVLATELPEYMRRFGELNHTGTRLVTSHNYRANPNDITGADAHQGTLTSRTFTIERRFVTVYVGGGSHATTAVRVLVDGQTVATASGANTEVLTARTLDVSGYQGRQAQLQIVDQQAGDWAHVNVDSIVFSDRADVLFEDWEKDTYQGWTVTGTAFGSGPVTQTAAPSYMRRYGDLNLSGTRFVTSHNFRVAGDPDGHQGTLTSAPFKIQRRYVSVALGGGNHPGTTCVNVLVGGQVVATATGADSEPMVPRLLDVGAHEGKQAQVQLVDNATGPWAHLNADAIVFTDTADILYEDWERTNYSGWTVTGTAFGAGPVTPAETPVDFRRAFGEISDLNVSGSRFVTSYNFRAGTHDTAQGTLTSGTFTITRAFVNVWVGGGGHRGDTCVNVLVGGQVVASATGAEIEPLQAAALNVETWRGQAAQIQIIDRSVGSWGHINVDRIVFSDRPIRREPIAERTDGGSFVLAALDESAIVRPSIADWSTTNAQFDSGPGPLEVSGTSAGQAGAVTTTATLAPGASRTFRYLLGWHFPVPERRLFSELVNASALKHHYAARFATAGDVARHVATNATALESGTRQWVKTWYEDSSLPHWFCERTLATASTIATNTCYRWSDGRFYAWEGAYCCAGTCQHVWNYAQAVGRLFPSLERDTRERVDLGIAFSSTGEIRNRGECIDASTSFADGQCGTILRIYREHQMTADNSFLTRVWPKVRTALEFLVTSRDRDGNGIFENSQWNTLDAEWFGEVPWLSGLYIATLHAGAAMATELGDTTFAQRYTNLAAAGIQYIEGRLWNASMGYYIQDVTSTPPAAMNHNRGCFIDQLYGQTYASQLGLPRVFPTGKARTALASVFRNNFLPNPAGSQHPSLPRARVYAVANEPGTLMCTWPNGGATEAGQGWQLGYFNEVWTGQEYQLAAGLFADGLVNEGLAVTRAVYDRYHGSKRNPYNEVECSDHYARAMMGFGTYLAACGYEYHGPKGHLGFAPKIGPEAFAGAFTAAQGWGLYRQTRAGNQQTGTVEVRHGQLRLATLAFETTTPATAVSVRVAGQARPATFAVTGNRVVVTLGTAATVATGQSVEVTLTTT